MQPIKRDSIYRTRRCKEALPIQIFGSEGEVRTLKEIEKDLLRLALLLKGGNVTRAAAQLGISRTKFYRLK
jgi:transcriptional regulator of acetoin/glycerol metabolism